MTGSMQTSFFIGYLPLAFFLYRESNRFELEVSEPAVQPAEVNLLLFIVRLAGTEQVQAARFRAYAWKFIQVKETKAKDKLGLRRTYIVCQDGFALVFLEEV